MTGQKALKIFDHLLEQNHLVKLKDTQAMVLSQVYDGKSYREIGVTLGYEPDYIKQIAANLWQVLSKIVGEKVSKSNIRSILQRHETVLTNVDWGEAIDVSYFYGRTTELQTLQDWVLDRHCRMVGIFGWGGIGKTALSVKLAQQLESQFDCVVWRSLRQAPSFDDLLNEVLPILVGSEVQESSVALLMQQLRQKRCLLILDNIEAILQPGNTNGLYLLGYEAYSQILQRISDENHQSCLVITGREKPNGMTLREGQEMPVRSLQLNGLNTYDAQQILLDKGISASLLEQSSLSQYVDGNPLALKLIATTIRNLFNGDIQAFLSQGTAVFGNLWELLNQQFERLSPLQQQLMYSLAISREGVTPIKLQTALIPSVTMPAILEALETLRDRSLIETTERGLTQQPVIMEYVTEKFIRQMEQEILTNDLNFFKIYPLIEAQTQDYVRDSQIQLILQPLLDRLLNNFADRAMLEQHLCKILPLLRHQPPTFTGYAAGNLINIFCYFKTNLHGFDFSGLAIRQAYLLNYSLYDVDLRNSSISQTSFAETFGGVIGIAFSPNGKYLATSDTKGDIQIWDANTLEKLSDCQGHQHWTLAVSFSPDGKYLASASNDYKVKLWDVTSGECLYTYTGHTYSVNTVTFSPNGQIIASASQDNTIRLWSISPDQAQLENQTLISDCGRAWSIGFSPDGQTLVSGGEEHSVRLWDVATGRCLATWGDHEDWIRSVVFSPNGKLIATGSRDRVIKIWDVNTKECLKTFQGHQDVVNAIAFSPNGQQVISGSYDRTLKLWDIVTGKCLKTLLGHRSRVWSVAFHPNGEQVASGGDDPTTKIWNLKLGRCINTIAGHTNAVSSVSVNADGQHVASGYEDKSVRIWDINSGKIVRNLREHSNRVWSVRFSPDGKILASGSSDYTIKIWDWQNEICLQTLHGHTSWVWKVVFSPDGQILVSSSYDKTIKIWDIQTGNCLNTLQDHTNPVVAIAVSPNGQLLASGDFGGNIKLWQLDSGKCYRDLSLHTNSVWSLAFSADGQWLVSASYDETLKLWSLATGECLQTFTGHQGAILNAKFSPDDQLIISSGLDGNIKVWNIANGECQQTMSGHHGVIYALDVATLQLPTTELSKLLVFTGGLDETIKIWDIAESNCLMTWQVRRPYEGMKIDRIQGLTKAQINTLHTLGAVKY